MFQFIIKALLRLHTVVSVVNTSCERSILVCGHYNNMETKTNLDSLKKHVCKHVLAILITFIKTRLKQYLESCFHVQSQEIFSLSV